MAAVSEIVINRATGKLGIQQTQPGECVARAGAALKSSRLAFCVGQTGVGEANDVTRFQGIVDIADQDQWLGGSRFRRGKQRNQDEDPNGAG